jgi:hypothetical protein
VLETAAMSTDVVCKTQPWDAGLASRSPLFWPIAGALAALVATMARAGSEASERNAGGEPAFPQPEAIDAALGPRAGIRF